MIVVSVRSFLASILVFSVVYTCFILSGHKYSLAPITNKLNSFVAQLHPNYTLHDPVIALIPRHRNQTINDKQWKTSTGERLSNIVLASTGSSITEPSNNLITTLTLIPRNQTINDKLWNTTTGERISNTVLTSTGSSITEPIYNLSYLTSPNYTSAPPYQQINMTFTDNRELPFSSHHHTHVLDQEAVAERFRQRQARVQHVCRGRGHWTLPNTLRDWIYYAPKHNILVCVTPKV
ncbi:hypothetical protein Pmani_021180 [Petrolisthes manimaculis]|uniref:Uncharacterized protein n=1 Tax=Petrolisthes manimaculis TaxID=1843537 RepID=A0AAE1PEP8_9EUCA|nr:hypothetical protein Pmani_021180 [Petrolisthes manimaculis]